MKKNCYASNFHQQGNPVSTHAQQNLHNYKNEMIDMKNYTNTIFSFFANGKTGFQKYLLITTLFVVSCFWGIGQTTVTYTQQTGNYYTTIGSGTYGIFNSGSYQVGMYANSSASKQCVSFRKFRTDGSGSSTGDRSLKVGDQFVVTLSACRAYGKIGFALLASPTSVSSWSDRENNYALSVNLDGPAYAGGSTYGNWYIKYNSGTTSAASFGGNNNVYNDFTITMTLTAPDRMNVSITDNTSSSTSNFYDVQLNSSSPITDYSIFLQDDYDGTGSKNVYWGRGAVGTQHSVTNNGSLPIGSSNSSFTESNAIPDGYAANSTSTLSSNTLTKSGTGTLTLSGVNTFSGGINLNGGTLQVGSTTNQPLNYNALSMGGGTLDCNGWNATIGALSGSSGSITIGGSYLSTLTISSSSNASYSGTVNNGSGTLSIVKSGSGTQTFGGTNTYTGGTTITAGTLSVSVDNNLGGTSSGLTLSGGTLGFTSGFTLNSGRSTSLTSSTSSTIDVASGNTVYYGGTISGSGNISKTSAGSLSLSGNSTFTGVTTVSAGTLFLGATGTSPNSPLGTVAAGTVVNTGAALDVSGYSLAVAEPLTINGTGNGGFGALTNSINTPATYSGPITLGAAASIYSSFGALTLTGGVTTAGYQLTLDGTIGGTISTTAITGTGSIYKTNTGTWTLSAANSYSGLTTINNGTLFLGSAGSGSNSPLGTTASGTVVNSGGALDLSGYTLATSESLTINGTGSSVLPAGALTNSSATAVTYSGLITLGSPATITANNGAIALSNTGTITGSGFGLTLNGSVGGSLASIIGTGSGTLTKSGSGTWTLSGVNTYSGTTTISGGTLTLGATNAIPSGAASTQSAVTINGGTLSTGAASAGYSCGTASYPMGSLTIGSSNGTIALATGSSGQNLYFADSHSNTWTGSLTITGWTGSIGSTGTNGHIYFGSTTGTLSSTQLAAITFSGVTGATGAILLSTGELVPAAIPTITSFATSVNNGTPTSGYVGSTVTITGTNYSGVTAVNVGATSVSYSVTNSTSITFTATAGLSGTITVTTGSGTSSASLGSYVDLGYVSTASSDWNTTSTWLGGAVPAASANVTIANAVTVTGVVSNAASTVTINSSQSLTFSSSGALTATTVVNNGTLAMSAGTLTIANAGTLTNNVSGGATMSGGTISFNGAATINGSNAIVFSTIVMNGALTGSYSVAASGTITTNTNSTVSGTVTCNGAVTINGTATTTLTTAVLNGAVTGSFTLVTSGTITTNTASTISGTVTCSGSSTVNGTATTTFTNLILNSATAFTKAPIINGTLQINAGGSVTTNAPTYGSSSTLIYNTGTGPTTVGTEWTGGATSGVGVPYAVTIGNGVNTTINFGSYSTYYQLNGDLTISASSTLTLSSNGSFNLKFAGNITNNGTFSTNSRGITFVGTSSKMLASSSNLTLDYLLLNSIANLTLSTSNFILNGNANALQFLNTGGLDLNQRSLSINTNGTILLNSSGSSNSIISTGGTGTLALSTCTITATSGTLSTSSNVTVTLSSSLTVTVANSLTIGGILQLNGGGYILNSTSSPIYSNGSTLVYNSGGNYGVYNEWIAGVTSGAGVPYNVQVGNGVASSALNLGSGNSTFTCNGSMNITSNTGATLALSTGTGGLNIGGSFTNNGTFTNYNKTVTLNATGISVAQVLSGSFNGGTAGTNNFYNLTINNTATGPGGVSLSNAVKVTNVLTLTSGIVTTNGNALNVTNTTNTAIAATTSFSSSTFINGAVTWSLPNSSSSNYIFPVGAGSTYLPFGIYSPSGTSPVVTVQAYTTDINASATYGSNLTGVSHTEYWLASNTGTFTSGTILLAKTSISPNTAVASSTSTSSFTSLGGTITSTLITSNTITANSSSGSLATPTYFVMAVSALPVITSFSASPGSGTSGYVGSTVTITGTNLGSATDLKVGSTDVFANVVSMSNTSTSIQFIATAGLSGAITITNAIGSGTSGSSYTDLGYISTASTDWNTGTTWLGGSVPGAGSTVTIANAVTVTSSVSNAPASVTINSGGSLTFSSSGALTATTVVNNGTLAMSAGTLTIAVSGTLTNNVSGGATMIGGTISLSGTATINGSNSVVFSTIVMNGAVTGSYSIASSGTITTNTNSTVSGTVTCNGSVTINGSATTTFNTVVFNGAVTGGFTLASSGTITSNTASAISGTVTCSGTATVNGSATTTFTNLSIFGAVTLSTPATIVGTLQTNNGGFITSGTISYSGSSSTLNYGYTGTSGSPHNFTQYLEWPATNGPANVIINGSYEVITMNASRSIAGSLTVTNGILQTNTAVTLTMSGTSQTITISNASGGVITGTDNGGGNNLSLVINNGSTTLLTGDETTNSDHEKKFYSVTVNSGGTLALSRGILCRYGTFSVNGTLQINANGYVQSGPTSSIPASYSSGSLVYSNGGPYTATDYEWPTSNSPTNVTVQTASTNITLNNPKTISGALTLSNGTLTVGANNLTIGGSISVTSGVIDASNGGATVTFGNSLAISLPATSFIGNVNNLTMNGAGGLALNAALTVAGTLTMTNGKLTTSGNSLTISNTANTAIAGGSTSSYVVGALTWNLPSGGSSNTYNFPVGISSTYLPFALGNPVGTGALTATVQVFSGGPSGGSASGLLSSLSSTEYWSLSTTGSFSGSGTTVTLTRQSTVSPYNAIGASSTVGGSYTSLGGSTTTYSIGPSSSIGSNKFFVFAQLTASPTVTSVTTNSPISGQTALGNGYLGQTVAIVGTGFVSGATVSFNGTAASSVTFNSATSLTATIPNGATTGAVTVTDPNTLYGNSSSFNILGYLSVNNTSADWNTPSTWAGNIVPAANVSVTVNTTVTVTGSVSNAASNVTINSGGSLAFNASGSLTASNLTNNGTLSMTAGTLTIAASGTLTNNTSGTSFSGGTVSFAGAGNVSGSSAITFNNFLTLSGVVNLNTAPTINGTLTINTLGGVAVNAPYYGASSTLFYNAATTTGSPYSRTYEWVAGTTSSASAGYPYNVTIGSSSVGCVLNVNNVSALQMGGTLTIGVSSGSSSSLQMNEPGTGSPYPLTVLGNVVVNSTGTLLLGNINGGHAGDLYVQGNFSNNGTFNNNGRAVFFTGSSAQTISGSALNTNSGTSNNFSYLFISNSSNPVTLANNIAVINSLTISSSANLDVSISNYSLTIGSTFSNSGTFTQRNGAVTFSGAVTVSGSSTSTFYDLILNGITTLTKVPNISNSLTLNSSSSVASASPVFGSNTSLIYNLGGGSGSKFSQSYEWPSSSGPTNVTLLNNTWVQLTASLSLSGNLTVTNGALQSLGGNSITMNGTTQTITVSTSSGGAIYGVDNGPGNDLSLTVASGSTTTFTGDATSSGDDEKKFFNINVNSGGTLALGRGILCKYGTFTVSGTLQINANGYVQATNGAAVSYSSGNLVYTTGGSYTTTDKEWPPISNTPTNVTIQTAGTNIILNDAKTISGTVYISGGTLEVASAIAQTIPALNWTSGNLTIDALAGLTLTGSYTPPSTTGSYTLNCLGTITLSSGSIASFPGSKVTVANTYSIGNLIVALGSSNSFNLSSTGAFVNVAGTLTLTSGVVNTSTTNYLSLSGTLSGGSSTAYINGPFTRLAPSNSTNYFFPIGTGTGYHPVNYSYTSSSDAANYVDIVATESALPGLPSSASTALFGARYYTIIHSTSGKTYNLGIYNGGNNSISGTALIISSNGSTTANNTTNTSTSNYNTTNSTITESTATTTVNGITGYVDYAELVETLIPVTITGVTANNKTYDGNTTATINIGSASVSGVVTGDVVTINTLSATATFVSAAVANGVTVNFTGFALSGANASAYVLSSQPTASNANITAGTAGVWLGVTSTNFSNASNWQSYSAPTSTDNITIASGTTYAPLLTATTTINNLSIASGATLGLGGQTLTINGTVSGSGNITSTSPSSLVIGGTAGTLNFASGNNTIKNLTLNSSSSATLGNQLNIVAGSTPGIVTVASGATLNTGGNLVLKSDASGTAMIAQSAGTISGNVTVERYIPAKTVRKFSQIASAVGGVTIKNSWQQQIYITGAGSGGSLCGSTNSNGFDVTSTGQASMFTYAATKTNGTRWLSVPNTNSTNLVPGIGYDVNIRGNRNSGTVSCADQLGSTTPAAPEAVTLSATGTVSTGTVNVSLNTISSSSFTLLGNPYPSPISFSAFQTSNSSKIYNKFWTYSPSGNGNYTTNIGGVYTNVASGYTTPDVMASGQAFFVQASADGSVNFLESHKTTTAIPNNGYFGGATNKLIRVSLKAVNDNSLLDEIVVRYNTNGSAVYNPDIDAQSLSNASQTLVSFKGTSRLAIATHPEVVYTDTTQLGVGSNAVGTYKLSFSDYQGLDNAQSITLLDKFLGTSQDMRANPEYVFNVTSNTASVGNNRFEMIVSGAAALPVNFTSVSAAKNSDGALIKWTIANEANITYYSVERSADAKNFIGINTSKATSAVTYEVEDKKLPTNTNTLYYRIKALANDGTAKYSSIAKLMTYDSRLTTLSFYPNPVQEKLNITLGEANGAYTVRIITVTGVEAVSKTGVVANGNTISIDASKLAEGVYMVELTDETGNKQLEKFVKK